MNIDAIGYARKLQNKIGRKTSDQKIKNVFILLILLSSSFDIFGVVDIGGMTLRISQLLIACCIVIVLISGKVSTPPKMGYLLIWMILQFIFALRSSNLLYSIGYCFWTVLSISIVFVFYNFVNTKKRADWLIKSYIISFVVMSFLGFFQWILGFAGISFYLTQTSFNATRIPRINGFTYEPSYYSTYLLPGWILVMYLWENGTHLFSKRTIMCFAIIISLALFLSTSRMGWIFMVVWLAYRGCFALKIMLKRELARRRFTYIAILSIGIIGVVTLAIYLINKNGIGFIVAGLGIDGSSAHSSSARTSQFYNTLQLFLDSPVIGLSLGGVPVKYCEKMNIVPFDSGASMCVWVELLAGSGIVGIIPFGIWFYNLITDIRVRKKYIDRRNECNGLFYALLFESMILAMNQNILRIYFWTLIGIVVVVTKQYKHSKRIFI